MWALITSDRFRVTIVTLIVIILNSIESIPFIDEATLQTIVLAVAAWVIGDSIKDTKETYQQRRMSKGTK